MSVTSTNETSTTRFIGFSTLLFGDANTTPTSLGGALDREPGAEVNVTYDEAEQLVAHREGPWAIDRTTTRVEVTANLLQFHAATLGLYMGIEEAGQLVNFGGAPSIRKEFAIRINGTDASGAIVRLDIFDCVISPNGPISMTPGGHAKLPIIIKALENEANAYLGTWQKGSGNDEITLATNVLTRVVGVPASRQYHQVVGEGNAADIVDTIVADGTPLADGEILTLQRKAGVDYAITITNNATGSDTVDLEGTDDVVLAKDTDTLVLHYDLSGTEWKEDSRSIDVT